MDLIGETTPQDYSKTPHPETEKKKKMKLKPRKERIRQEIRKQERGTRSFIKR